MSNITDIYETDTINFPVTALLFESNLVFTIINRYTVSDNKKSVTGIFKGEWVSEAGISMPRDSYFVTLAIPNEHLTVTQKLVVDWFNEETEESGIDEFDLKIIIS